MKDLPWRGLSSDPKTPRVFSWSSDWPCRWVVEGPALWHPLHTWPSPTRSPFIEEFTGRGDSSNTKWNSSLEPWCESHVPCPQISHRRGPRLGSLGYLGPSLRLILFRRDTSALFHHILPLLLSFPLLVCGFKLKVMRSRKRKVFSLTSHLGCLAPCLRLHDL